MHVVRHWLLRLSQVLLPTQVEVVCSEEYGFQGQCPWHLVGALLEREMQKKKSNELCHFLHSAVGTGMHAHKV